MTFLHQLFFRFSYFIFKLQFSLDQILLVIFFWFVKLFFNLQQFICYLSLGDRVALILFHNFIEQSLKKITLFSNTKIGTSALGTKQMIFFLEHKKIVNNLKQAVYLSITFLFNHAGRHILWNFNESTTK
jgi:hypothetical protein